MKAGLWFALLISAYLAFAGTLSLDGCIAGVAVAAVIATFQYVAHQSLAVQFRLTRGEIIRIWLAALPRLLTDTIRLLPCMLSGANRPGVMSQDPISRQAKFIDCKATLSGRIVLQRYYT